MFFSIYLISYYGYPTGRLTGCTVENCGKFIASYSSNLDIVIGQIAFAHFPNPDGLNLTDNNLLVETSNSRSPTLGVPCENECVVIQGDHLDL